MKYVGPQLFMELLLFMISAQVQRLFHDVQCEPEKLCQCMLLSATIIFFTHNIGECDSSFQNCLMSHQEFLSMVQTSQIMYADLRLRFQFMLYLLSMSAACLSPTGLRQYLTL